MNGRGEKFSRNQEKAIICLLQNPTIEGAARDCGIGEATLSRWLQNPEFAEKYLEAKRQLLTGVIRSLVGAAAKAVETLLEVMESKESPPAARVSAARATLEFTFRGSEYEDITQRLANMEKEIAALAAMELAKGGGH